MGIWPGWKTLVFLFLISGLVSVSLTSCVDLNRAYVQADEATYLLIAPEYQGYVDGDVGMSRPAKEVRGLLLRSWKMRIDAAKSVGQ